MNIINPAKIDLDRLPLISSYRVVCWGSRADGSQLTPLFNVNNLVGKYIVIKSLRFIPYTFSQHVDIELDDGAGTVFTETVGANLRVNRIFDDFVFGTTIYFRINDVSLPIFESNNQGYPIDLFLDNIYYLFPSKLETIFVGVNTRLSDVGGGLQTPNIKVVMECYLI